MAIALIKRKSNLSLILAMTLLISQAPLNVSYVCAFSYSIELEGFRWHKFPLKVLVDMNQWSSPDYATVMHETLDSWIMSIWAYTKSSNDKTLRIINYTFYVSNINSTDNYDIFMTFTPNEISPTSIGLTTYMWNIMSHEPIPPITINITTYSGTIDHLFMKNVAMHELGHALGLDHASSQNTADGPELMYYMSSGDQIVYPSTLDLYGLTMLYQGSFGRSVQLPSSIPYKIVWPLTYGRITIISGLDNATIIGAGDYPLGTAVTLKAPDSIELSNKTKLLFSDWDVLDTHTIIPTAIASIVVYGYITIIVDWNVEYYVDVRTPFSGANAKSGYLLKGSFVNLNISDEIVDLGNGTKMVYKSFNPNNFYISKPVVCFAIWERQYWVNVTSTYGTLSFFKWVPEGDTVNVTAPDFLSPPDWRGLVGVRQHLGGWIVNGQFKPARSLSLIADSPLSITAIWEADYTYTAILFAPLFILILWLALRKIIKQRRLEKTELSWSN